MILRGLVLIGAFGGLLSVALGAFAAHGLRTRLSPEMLSVFQTGVQYQFYHSLALLMVGAMAAQGLSVPGMRCSALLFAAGIVIFSGSLYVLALTGIKWLGAITPIGGVCFLAGWLALIVTLYRYYPQL